MIMKVDIQLVDISNGHSKFHRFSVVDDDGIIVVSDSQPGQDAGRERSEDKSAEWNVRNTPPSEYSL